MKIYAPEIPFGSNYYWSK